MDAFPISPSVILPGKGRIVEAFGDKATFMLTGEETGGRYTMFLSEAAPGCGPPLHWHEVDDEWFFVLDGKAEFYKEGEWTEVPPGTAVFIPHGCIHSFRNAGDTPLKQIIQTAPSGFETFFTRCAAEFNKEGGADMAKIVEISAEHGIHYTG